MNIAIDVSQMCYEGTGVARYVRGLTQALLTQDSTHTFVLYAGALRQQGFFKKIKTTSPWNKATWKILPLPPRIASLSLNALPIPFEMLVGKVDLIHTSDWAEPSSSCPRVTTVHDLVFIKYPETVDALILATQAKRLKKIIADKTHIIADSRSTKADLMEIYGLPATSIDVVYPGLDSAYTPKSETEIARVKAKYNLPDNYVLSIGTNEPRKNLDRLIKACIDLDQALVLTGRYGWGAGSESTSSKVISTGYVDEADLPGLYSGAKVFAYPSLYEGFGFPVLEAMACGTPVVTSNVSSLPEIVGQAGVLIDPMSVEDIKNGILKAIAQRDTYIKLGLVQSQNFTWDKAAKQVLEVYEKITNRN